MASSDSAFVGRIPEIYEELLVPLVFAEPAGHLAEAVLASSPHDVLETAAGTGVLTRALVAGGARAVTATDLNEPMLRAAQALCPSDRVTWQVADALSLPVPAASYDVVACQFGVMFFPDKAKALAEARRVLRPGGVLIYNVWDRLAENQFADTIAAALASMFPANPPGFLARTPYGYYEHAGIERDLRNGGFTARPEIVTLAARSRARSARDAAIAYCQGTPLRSEIEERGASRLEEATDVAAEAIAKRFGRGAVDGKIQAHVVTVER